MCSKISSKFFPPFIPLPNFRNPLLKIIPLPNFKLPPLIVISPYLSDALFYSPSLSFTIYHATTNRLCTRTSMRNPENATTQPPPCRSACRTTKACQAALKVEPQSSIGSLYHRLLSTISIVTVICVLGS